MLSIPDCIIQSISNPQIKEKEDLIMQIRNFKDIFSMMEFLYQYLNGKDIKFNHEGFPEFRSDMFLNEWPDLVIPYSQRKNKRVKDKSKTVICFFDKDQRLYPRLKNVLEEIEEYKSFMGVIGLDITITDDMDEEWQKAILLLNQLFMAVLAINGIKIIVNTRTAGLDCYKVLEGIPSNIMAASGFLGCDKLKKKEDFSYLSKILTIMPDKLIIYGKHDLKVEEQLDEMGIDYRVYKDFHRLCKEVHHG